MYTVCAISRGPARLETTRLGSKWTWYKILVWHRLPLRLSKGLVCLASRTCADGMWYHVMITAQIEFVLFLLLAVVNPRCDVLPVTTPAKIL